MQMKLLLMALCAVVSSFEQPMSAEMDGIWEEWKTQHGKQYSKGFRRMIWETNQGLIRQHNLEAEIGKHTFTLGMNQFGDMVGPCEYQNETKDAWCKGFNRVPALDEKAFRDTLYEVGPIAVSVNATHPTFKFYKDGVLYQPDCSTRTDHAVLAVGYGSSHLDYWIVKNSWGTGWGRDGYIPMARGYNQCGIAVFVHVDTLGILARNTVHSEKIDFFYILLHYSLIIQCNKMLKK